MTIKYRKVHDNRTSELYIGNEFMVRNIKAQKVNAYQQNPSPKYCRFDAKICLPELHAQFIDFVAEKVPGETYYTYCEENHLKQAHFTQTVK